MKTPRVFVSMGTPYRDQYSQFRDGLEALLRDRCGVDARIIGKNEYPPGNPVHKIKNVMSTCDGVLVVAYERKFVEVGCERRGGENKRDIKSERYTTPWNHVESAMAFSLGIPLYIICESGLTEEALIETKVDWYVQYMDLSAQSLANPAVTESLRSWVQERVVPRTKSAKLFLGGLGERKFSETKPKEWMWLIGLLIASFSAGATVARLVPHLFSAN